MDPINPSKTLVEKTYDTLLDAICAGEFQPGERLNQDEIAARLNVSRQPVNSAISVLKSHGFVTDTGRRGVIVAAVDPVQFQYIYEFRSAIEPLAVTLAGQRLPPDAAEVAQDILVRGSAAVKSGDQKAWLVADMAFHEMIYRWGGNTVIQSSMRLNWQHIRRSMAEVLRDVAAAQVSWEEHERIIHALMRGDVEIATSEMRAHIETASDKTMVLLRQQTAPAAPT